MDVYLTQNFNMDAAGRLPEHAVEFPFTFASYDMLSDLFSDFATVAPTDKSVQRGGVLLSRGPKLKPEQLEDLEKIIQRPVLKTYGTPESLFQMMTEVKYFIFFARSPVWGNAVAEALAAGAVVVGCCGLNSDVMALSGTYAANYLEISRVVRALEADPVLFEQTREVQRQLFTFLAYDRPLYQLLDRAGQILKKREISAGAG